MIRSVLPAAVMAVLGLSACGTDPNNIRAPAPSSAAAHVQPTPYRAGSGVVQSVTAAPTASAGATAAARAPVTTTRGEPVSSAGTTAVPAGQMQRLAIRMDDGRIQYVDMAGPDVPPVGSRVQLTPDHQILRQ